MAGSRPVEFRGRIPVQETTLAQINDVVQKLSFKEVNEIRKNITLNVVAPNYTRIEQRVIRVTCKGPLVPVSPNSEEMKEAAVPFMHMFNMIQHGTLASISKHVQGIMWIC